MPSSIGPVPVLDVDRPVTALMTGGRSIRAAPPASPSSACRSDWPELRVAGGKARGLERVLGMQLV